MTNTVETVETVETKQQLVTMTDGSVKNFGDRGRLLSTQVINAEGIEVVFHVVTGEQVTFKLPAAGVSPFILEAAAYGFASKAKNATSGTPVEQIAATIAARVAEYDKGVWVLRAASGESLVALSQTQTAYAMVHGIDPTSSEGIAKVNAIFAALTKEAKADLVKAPAIQVAIAKIRLAAAEAAALEATETN
jgi:hypothetical protein